MLRCLLNLHIVSSFLSLISHTIGHISQYSYSLNNTQIMKLCTYIHAYIHVQMHLAYKKIVIVLVCRFISIRLFYVYNIIFQNLIVYVHSLHTVWLCCSLLYCMQIDLRDFVIVSVFRRCHLFGPATLLWLSVVCLSLCLHLCLLHLMKIFGEFLNNLGADLLDSSSLVWPISCTLRHMQRL